MNQFDCGLCGGVLNCTNQCEEIVETVVPSAVGVAPLPNLTGKAQTAEGPHNTGFFAALQHADDRLMEVEMLRLENAELAAENHRLRARNRDLEWGAK